MIEDDGLCFFDYDVVEPGEFDYTSLNHLLTMARTLLSDCVVIRNRGGEATGLGALDFGPLWSHDSRWPVTLRSVPLKVLFQDGTAISQ